jgi:hypothetical protein
MCDTCNPNWEPPAPGEGETFDSVADAMDAKRHAAERETRAAAGIPEPTLAELGRSLGYAAEGRLCVSCGTGEQVEGGLCIRCVTVEERRREWWAA